MKALVLAWRVSKPWMRITAIAILLIVAVKLIGAFSGGQESNRATPAPSVHEAAKSEAASPDYGDRDDAVFVCKKFVATSLKATSTAKFAPDASMRVVNTLGKDGKVVPYGWTVSGWVDAQNGFGAMLRSEFECTAFKINEGKWELIGVKLTPH